MIQSKTKTYEAKIGCQAFFSASLEIKRNFKRKLLKMLNLTNIQNKIMHKIYDSYNSNKLCKYNIARSPDYRILGKF